VTTATRLHDRDHSAWWLPWSLLPVLGWVVLAVTLCLLGSRPAANRYGPPPRAERTQAAERSASPGSRREPTAKRDAATNTELPGSLSHSRSPGARRPAAPQDQQVAETPGCQLTAHSAQYAACTLPVSTGWAHAGQVSGASALQSAGHVAQ
jgi:hypothetical protein